MTPLTQLDPHRIALIKPSALGDVCHALPVLTALRHRWPAAHITWVVNRAYAPLLDGHPDLDAVLPFDRGLARRGPIPAALAMLGFARQLRAGRFDLVIDLQGLLRTGLMSRATGAARRVGFANAREGATRFYTDCVAVPDADEIHAVDRYWRIAGALGAGDGAKQFHVPLNADARRQAAELLAPWPRPYIVLAVGARWITKRWPPEQFAAAARHALMRFGGTVVFVGAGEDESLARATISHLRSDALAPRGAGLERGDSGSLPPCGGGLGWGVETSHLRVPTPHSSLPPQGGREEGTQSRSLIETSGSVLNLCGQTPLALLAAVLAQADVVLANDTGPLHLAAALGQPVVAPYTCTLVRKHGPYGQLQRTASATVVCHGSYVRQCDHLSCLPTVPAARITPLIDEVLGSWQRRRIA